jgi:hypothetical protein
MALPNAQIVEGADVASNERAIPVRATVPVRTILATIGLILATVVAVLFVMRVEQVLVWMLIALFFTVAIYPLVGLVQRRVTRCRRSWATLLVFLVVILILGGLLTAFAVPLATQGTQLAGQLPEIIADAKAGRGPVGDLLERTNALQFVQNNQARISAIATSLGTPALNLLRGLGTGVVAAVTIFVLSYLPSSRAPRSSRAPSPCSPRSAPSASAASPATAPRPSPATSPATCSLAPPVASSPTRSSSSAASASPH